MQAYQGLGSVYDRDDQQSTELLRKHFDQIAQQSAPLSAMSNLEGLLKKMKTCRYTPSPEQLSLIREGKDSIDMKTVNNEQKALLREFLEPRDGG